MKWKVFLALRVLLAMLVLMILLGLNGMSKARAATWTQIWSDEFGGSANTGVNTTNWLYDTGTAYPGGVAQWGTSEIETMTNSTANVYQDGATPYGHLVIKPILSGASWTSGRIETQNIFTPPAGGQLAVEASIQLPAGAVQGYWPAFWMLGAGFRGVYTNWPSIGEIDAMENANGTNTIHGTFHCGVNPGGPCNETTGLGGTTACSPNCQGALHTYRVEIDRSTSPEEIRWYLDGVQYWQVFSNNAGMDATTWANAVDHGFFIIFNVAIGGVFPGPPATSTVSGASMLVDYVRVFTSGGSGAAAVSRAKLSGRQQSTSNSSSFTQGVVNSNSTTSLCWFKPSGWTANSVSVRYSIRPSNSWQTPTMVYNSLTARWEYTISGIHAGKTLRYQFTYTKSGQQQSTKLYSWVHS